MSEIIIPSSPADRQKLMQIIKNITDCMVRIDGEKEAIKEILEEAKEQFEIPPKMIKKLASAMHKANVSKVLAENDDFETLVETLVQQTDD